MESTFKSCELTDLSITTMNRQTKGRTLLIGFLGIPFSITDIM